MPESGHPTLAILGDANVRAYIGSRFFSSLARAMLYATIAWHLWKVTGSYAYLGVLGLVEFAPVIPVSLYAGALADRMDRRRIVLATQAFSLLGAGALALASRGDGSFEVATILGAAFALAIATAFENPAGGAILPSLVARERFASATVVMSNVRNVGRLSGPVLMGVIAGSTGVAGAYATGAACLGASLVLLARVRLPPISAAGGRVTLEAIGEGIAFLRGQPVIVSSMALDMFAVIFAGATAMLPVYADEILGVGERGYGLLAASMQLGTMLMAAILLFVPPIDRAGRALLFAVVAYGVSTVLFGVSRTFSLSVAAFVLAGMADQVSMVTRSIILQLSTPDALRGRVNSVNMIFIGASNELGAAESGFLAALTSATFSVVAGGVACLGVVAAVAAGVPSLRAYRSSDTPG